MGVGYVNGETAGKQEGEGEEDETELVIKTDGVHLGKYLITILARGIASPWKQVIAMGITTGNTNRQAITKFVDESIIFLEKCGLYVTSLTSDMGDNNRAFWTSLDVKIQRAGHRKNFFLCNGHKVFIIPDPCHLLKNLKAALCSGTLTIPDEMKEAHELPTIKIDGSWIETLWHLEVNRKQELHTLHHLKFDDLYPDNFIKMHVGSAVRYFAHQTAAALELPFIKVK